MAYHNRATTDPHASEGIRCVIGSLNNLHESNENTAGYYWRFLFVHIFQRLDGSQHHHDQMDLADKAHCQNRHFKNWFNASTKTCIKGITKGNDGKNFSKWVKVVSF
jgi:hypothetical protein